MSGIAELWKDPAFRAKHTQRGPLSHNWKGGRDPHHLKIWQEVREQALERDNYTCQDCDASECRIEVHHVDFDAGHHTLDNALSLCSSCHRKRHNRRRRMLALHPNKEPFVRGRCRHCRWWMSHKLRCPLKPIILLSRVERARLKAVKEGQS